MIMQKIDLRFPMSWLSFQFYQIYMFDDYKSSIEIIIDIFSKLFKNTEMNGLQVFNAMKYEKSINDIIITLIYGYYFNERDSKTNRHFMKNLIISQKKNLGLYSSYKNPNINITFTFFNLFLDYISFKNINRGKAIKNTIKITKLKFYILDSSDELPHSKLRSINEYDLFRSRLRQKKQDRDFSKRTEQKDTINIYRYERIIEQNPFLNSLFLIKNATVDAKVIIRQIIVGMMKVKNKSEQPTLLDSGLYQEIRQFKEKKGELNGLQNKNQRLEKEEIISIFVNQIYVIQIQI
ncbi:hypothetical protein ABPG74_020295 [Tetrahymena malaccensis]